MPGWGEGCPGGHGDVEASIDGRVFLAALDWAQVEM